MERRRALAAAASTSVVALAGSLAWAANSGTGILGFGGAEEASAALAPTTSTWVDLSVPVTDTVPPDTVPLEPVVVTDLVYDDQYVVVPTPTAALAPSAVPVTTAPAVAVPTTPAATVAPPTVAPTTVPPATTTTVPGPQQLPRGFRVPEDWPADRPYPPIPEGCERGVLEDNGRWNCENEDD